jgi:hypothetical protein
MDSTNNMFPNNILCIFRTLAGDPFYDDIQEPLNYVEMISFATVMSERFWKADYCRDYFIIDGKIFTRIYEMLRYIILFIPVEKLNNPIEITVLTLVVSSKTNPTITTIEDDYLDKSNLDLLKEKFPEWAVCIEQASNNKKIKDFINIDNLHWDIAKRFCDMNKDVEYDYNKFIKIDRIYTEIRKLEKPIKQECIDSWFY